MTGKPLMLTIMTDDAHDYVCKMLKLRLYDKLFIRVRIEHSKLNVFKNCQNMTFLLLDYSAPKKKATTMILYGVKGYRTIHFSFLLFSCKAQYYFSTNTRELKKS